MAEGIRARDIEVTTSKLTTEALSLIAAESYDAVIMDLMMPEIDGIHALATIKKKKPEMQIILLTGYATVQKGVNAMKAGAMDFMEKPVDLDAILEKIKKAHNKKTIVVEKQNQDKIIELLRKFGM